MSFIFPATKTDKNSTTKEKILFFLIVLFLFTLYFSQVNALSSALAGIITLYSFFYNSFTQKWELLKQRPAIQFMLLFFLMLLVSTLFSENIKAGFRELEIRLPLLLFPIGLGLICIRKEFKEKLLLAFAFITTFVCIICLVSASYTAYLNNDPAFLYNDALTDILHRQSVYIGLTVNISVFILAYFILIKKHAYKGLMALAVLFLFGISYLIASRVMFATLIFSGFGYVLYHIVRHKNIKQGLLLLAAMVAGIILIYSFFPQTFNRYKELAYSSYDFENKGKESHYNMKITEDQWNGANFRLAAWACGLELIQENPVFGVGLGDRNEALTDKYKQKNFHFAIETDKNVHSNYIDILYTTGIFGFLIFAAGWIILPLLLAFKHKDGLMILIILTFCLAWITEVYFARSFGVMLTGFFISFLLSDKKTSAE